MAGNKRVKSLLCLLFSFENFTDSPFIYIFTARIATIRNILSDMNIEIVESEETMTGILHGRLDTESSNQFARDIEPLMDKASKHIILDCNDLEYIASSGLRLLLSLRKQSIAMGGDVTIKGISPKVKMVFTITGFYSLFSFEE